MRSEDAERRSDRVAPPCRDDTSRTPLDRQTTMRRLRFADREPGSPSHPVEGCGRSHAPESQTGTPLGLPVPAKESPRTARPRPQTSTYDSPPYRPWRQSNFLPPIRAGVSTSSDQKRNEKDRALSRPMMYSDFQITLAPSSQSVRLFLLTKSGQKSDRKVRRRGTVSVQAETTLPNSSQIYAH
ncbi:MAG: hypothetical protein BWY43_00592 [candidate division WS2 bacterium ADurb.Bin280]|uniref:Uncharacterized protein n=1 Tax=candidate division WS2 bacterium ADurb.Bin280 TaxID=1852829 RepID=A0A1V5SD06_9BACT|nr:MAG: hypothetical protein BWY43_00592 [candidate division WS2 bacterium ADurb.Bin280]